jgi:chemotaxis signal transduction protein
MLQPRANEGFVDSVPRYAVDIGMDGVGVVFAEQVLLELPYAVSRCPLPGAPPWWRGAINHRGFVVPRLDIARWLGLDDSGGRVEVIIDVAPHSTAWLLAEAPQLLHLQPSTAPIPDVVPEPLRRHVRAVWSSDAGAVIELEHRKMLVELARRGR